MMGLGFLTRGAGVIETGKLEDFVPDELDPATMKAGDMTRLGGMILRNSKSLLADLDELAQFGSLAVVNLTMVFVLNRRRRAMNLPNYKGISENKMLERIIPTIQQILGFFSEVLDIEGVKTLDELVAADGEHLLAYAASLNALEAGPTVMEMRMDALSEVVQFLSVRNGCVDERLFTFSLSLKDLGRHLATLRPRAPRFADQGLLERADEHFAEFYRLLRYLQIELAHMSDDAIRRKMTLCYCIRAFALTAFMTPFLGGHRGQTVARIQASDDKHCITCGHARCPGNRVKVLGEKGTRDGNKIRVTLAHHKNQLAGRTRAVIDYTVEDERLADLLRVYMRVVRPALHARVLRRNVGGGEGEEFEDEEEVVALARGGGGERARRRRARGDLARVRLFDMVDEAGRGVGQDMVVMDVALAEMNADREGGAGDGEENGFVFEGNRAVMENQLRRRDQARLEVPHVGGARQGGGRGAAAAAVLPRRVHADGAGPADYMFLTVAPKHGPTAGEPGDRILAGNFNLMSKEVATAAMVSFRTHNRDIGYVHTHTYI